MINLIFGSFVLWAMPFNPADCTNYRYIEQNVQFYRQLPNPTTCWLSVIPEGVNLVMRTYLLDPNGLFMVFNSYGEGPNSSHTGARVFHFFPRGRVPYATKLNSQEILVQTATPGIDLIMNSRSGRWSSNQRGGQIIEANRISRNNRGGIEFKNFQMLILDSGFQMGQDPRDASKTSTFYDPEGYSCELPNNELFLYDSEGSLKVKFQNDQDLLVYLRSRCPKLNLTLLR